MVNVDKLKGRMVEKRINATDLAKKLEINRASFYKKMKASGVTFSLREIDLMAETLNLTAEDVIAIFFSQYVAWNEKNKKGEQVWMM